MSPNYCSCRPGFASPACNDINECLSSNGGCNQHCTNMVGSYRCYCDNGYILDSDNRTCKDVDECLDTNGGCNQICINKGGSYECQCKPGFVLGSDTRTCTDKNECLLNNGGCSQTCVNEYQSYHCACKNGFQLGSDGKRCDDIDECSTNSKCAHSCSNTVGSYRCSCRSGYQLALDGLSCSDTDNCVGVNCRNSGHCIDNIGSYSCKCAPGFDGQLCENDVNECLFINGGCDEICVNTPGSYQCQCQQGKSLNADGRCSGKKNATGGLQQTVFEVHKLARRLLPKGCAVLELASCGEKGLTKNIIFSSTSSWYKLSTNSSIYFTMGIVFVESGDFSFPVSISGLEVISTNSNFELVFGSLKYYVVNGIELYNRRNHTCFFFETTPRDVHALIASFVPTAFDKLYGVLPNWIRFSESGTRGLSITDLKTDLVKGEELRSISDCKGAPVYDGRLYSVFRFGTNMSITLFENKVNLPVPLVGNKFCLVVDICEDNGGTAFLLIPPESRSFLEKFDIFKTLKQNNGVIFRPYGIGLSLTKNIDVTQSKKQIIAWNGDNFFQYPVLPSANVWLHSNFEWEFKAGSFSLKIEGITEIFLAGPTISNLLTGLFVDEWNALVQIKELGLTPAFTFKLFNQDVTLALQDMYTASIEAYLSIGGQQARTWCGNGANPEGVFLSFMASLNPFRDVPLVKDWLFDENVRFHAFVTTSPNHIQTLNTTINVMTDIEDLSAAIHRFSDVVVDLIKQFGKDLSDTVRKGLWDLQMLSVSFAQLLAKVIKTGQVDISEIAGNIWTTYVDSFKRKGQGVLDLLEFEKDVVSFNITRFIKEEQTIIGHNVDKLLSKVNDQVFTAIKSYNGFGLRFSANLYMIKLGFGQMDIEFVYSVDRLGQCNKFKKIYELLKGEPSAKILARPTFRKTLGKIPSLGRFKFLGSFLKFEVSSTLSIALSITSNKFFAHLHTHASVLGMKASGDLFISNNQLVIELEGNLWNVYFARLSLSTELGKQWKDITYNVSGKLVVKRGENDFGGSYLEGLLILSQKAADAANKRFDAAKDMLTYAQHGISKGQETLTGAQQKIKNCNTAFDAAVYSMNKEKHALDRAKGPFERANENLNKAQKHLDNLCKIKTCYKVCVPGLKFRICKKGWFRYPCVRTTSCMFRIPNIACTISNAACGAVRAIAYVALEVAKVFVRVPMLALDVAKSVVSFAQFVVDKSRVVLLLAEGVLEVAKFGLKTAKVVLEVAKARIDAVKFIVGAALHVFDLVVKYGLQSLFDVRNCRFEIKLSTEDKAFFNVSCEVQAFRLHWHTLTFEFDFRHPAVSMWRIAKSTIKTLLEFVGDIFGKRKRRAISYKSMSKLHHIIQIYKRDVTNQSVYSNFFEDHINGSFQHFDESSEVHFKNKFKTQIEYFAFNCELFRHTYSFLSESIESLYIMTNESIAALNDVLNVQNTINDMNTPITADNLTAESLGISTDYALREFNITDEDIRNAIDNATDMSSDDSTLSQMANASSFAAELLDTQMADADSISVIDHWIYGMTNTSRDYFDETECYDFKDCVLYSFSQLHDLFDDDTILDIEYSRNATALLEDQFSELLFNSSRSIKDTNRLLVQVSELLTRLNYSNVFCAIPPSVSIADPNRIALVGSSIKIICNVTGDSRHKSSWYFNGTLLFGANQDVLLLSNIQQIQEGIYKCIAENVVANVSSNDVEIFVKECPPGTFFDNNVCSLCTIDMYQPEKNQRTCIACGTGLKTSAMGSTEVAECVDKVKITDKAKIAAGVIVGFGAVIAVLFGILKLMQPKKMKVKPYPYAVKRPDSMQKPVVKHAFVDSDHKGKN